MDKQTITFRADPKKVKALDRLARSLDRDRSYVLNEAVEQYLSVHQYHLEQIEKGLEEARAGKLVDYDKVKAGWRKRLDR
jgi:predicted transcriptional regulator